ncbi:MAG: betaine-aldehyde dehydrogenase [Pseudomonadota bacterium]
MSATENGLQPHHAQPVASCFIDGGYVESTGGEAMPQVFAGTGETIATVHAATPDLIEKAVQSATRAQLDWARLSGAKRGRVLKRAANIMRTHNRALSELETLDTGKPIQETLVADAASGADALEYFGGLAASLTGDHIPLGQDFAYTTREPLGVCAAIGAWNYPTQIACWKAAPALATGNAVIFKPSELTPLCALKVAEIFIEAGLPPGLFNVVQGAGDVGRALVTHNGVHKVSLTGSVPTGRKVYAEAAANLKHATMELGGKSPIIVFDDADLDCAVGGVILGNFYSSGQVCSNGTRVFVQSGIRERFLARMIERVSQAVIGDPRDPETSFGPMISAAQLRGVERYVETARAEGATVALGGERLDRPGFFYSPTILTDVSDDMTVAREEIFGPVASVLDFDDEADVIDRANATPFGLSAGVFTQDLTRAHRVIGALDAGTCWINTYNLAPVEVPFGGMKASGIGRENARAAIDAYTQIKSVYVGMGPVDAPY